MTSAPSRRQPLNGNRWVLYVFIALFTAACSPKLHPVVVQPVKKEPEKPVVQPPPSNNKIKPAAKVSSIALLLPFGLDHLSTSSYNSTTLKEADIAVDYYRGFKLALDSLTGEGYSYKLLVFDSRGEKAQAHSLANNPAVRSSDLIVGPIFPEDVKAFTAAYPNGKQPVVSPLSPASPATYKNPQVITIMPPLEYHAWTAARYINEKIKPEKIFVLRSGFSEENEYLIPFKRTIDSISRKRVKIMSLTVIHGQLGSLIPQLSATAQNVFVVPATDQHFLTITLRALDTLAASYPVTVFGHPSWIKYNFLKTDMLQRLNTHITSAERIDYKAANTIAFTRRYREIYHTEPSVYAIKGFDEGMYLGQRLGADELKNLAASPFTGIHNSFQLLKKPGLGWINTHVGVYKYTNFELKKVE